MHKGHYCVTVLANIVSKIVESIHSTGHSS